MPIKESFIETQTQGVDRIWYKVPVFYTDELVVTSVYDLAFSSVIGGNLPYLFVEYLTDGKDFNKWYFSNARMHEEMHEALMRDLGEEYPHFFGQIHFSSTEHRVGKLIFNILIMHSPLPSPNEKVIKLLRQSISPGLLTKDFKVTIFNGVEFHPISAGGET